VFLKTKPQVNTTNIDSEESSFRNVAPFIDKGSIITIKYKSGNKTTIRNIEIKSINDDKVKAFCMLRNTLRTFKIDNIIEWNPSDNFKIKGRIGKELFGDKFMFK
jgi:predicted DNA-binding transcriptional regulator YafY